MDGSYVSFYYFYTNCSIRTLYVNIIHHRHADEVEYVFGHPLNMSRNYTNSERELSRRVMKYFTTFAKTG